MKVFGNLPSYIYATSGNDLFVNQYISSTADLEINGAKAQIIQHTDLPNGNKAFFSIKANGKLSINLRMPSWASNAIVKVNGMVIDYTLSDEGYIVVDRNWTGNDRLEIEFTKEVIYLRQEAVTYNAGQVAIQYGPFIYCAESEDNHYENLINDEKITFTSETKIEAYLNDTMFELRLNANEKKVWETVVLKGKVLYDDGYMDTITLIPFYLRGNRINGSMRVWFKELK